MLPGSVGGWDTLSGSMQLGRVARWYAWLGMLPDSVGCWGTFPGGVCASGPLPDPTGRLVVMPDRMLDREGWEGRKEGGGKGG